VDDVIIDNDDIAVLVLVLVLVASCASCVIHPRLILILISE
jgi:hypothetical protein